MPLTKKEVDELQPIIKETVTKRLGFPENAVIKAAVACLQEELDHDMATEKMSSLLGDDLAPRFVEDLQNAASRFRRSKSAVRKRPSVADEDPESLKKAKLNRLSALIDDEPLPPTLPEKTEKPPANVMENASNINAMVANVKRQIEERKKMLIQSGVAPALIQQSDQRVQKTKEQQQQALRDEKAKRAAELQAKIAAKSNKLLSGLSALKNLPIKPQPPQPAPDTVPISEMTRPAAVVLDAEGNPIDQATGRQISITKRMPTLKVNIRERKKEELKNEEVLPQASTATIEEDDRPMHFDPRMGTAPATRGRRNFTFHRPGKFQQLGQKMRAKAQMEKLQRQIQEVAKKTGISSAAKLAMVAKKEEFETKYIPDIEWWDMALLPNHTYKDLDRTLKEDEELFTGVTNLVEHPIAKDAPSQPKSMPNMPVFLTKKERKKIRTQRRREEEKEKNVKIRLGLEPPPPPKVKISNLMRVLASEAVQDPTKVEAHVRAQMAARQKKHEQANEERKLTKEQRTEKKIKKLKEDTSLGVHIAVYSLLDLSNPSKKFKVDTNATQLYLTGSVLITKELVLVIAEGGPKSQKKFKRLMMHRIKWDEDTAQGRRQDKIDKKKHEYNVEKQMNKCQLVWEGTAIEKTFSDWKFHLFKTETEAQEFLRKSNIEHYWNLAKSRSLLEED